MIDLARDVMVADDRLRVVAISPSSFDHRLCSAIHPCSSASSVVNTAIQFSRVQCSSANRSGNDAKNAITSSDESVPC
jgi:hypothetical protein